MSENQNIKNEEENIVENQEDISNNNVYPFYRSLVKYTVYGAILAAFLWIFISITIQVFKPDLAPSRDFSTSE
ncbi:hypothetical protein KKF34_10835 [Myxococcota bacterium]|nr:hypothetical protein [Myxococcota bacterium]MBU1382814.1 hypothetical protein [Myxococcota bacterium]MBU1497363.1 hypothetical protein [Myxococcota bacterium]